MRLANKIATLCVLAFTSGLCFAQAPSKYLNGCVVKETIRPSIFISYEAATGPGNDRMKTLLRLHNNTNCTIVIETSDLMITPEAFKLFKTITKRDANGSMATTFIPDPSRRCASARLLRQAANYQKQTRARELPTGPRSN